MIRFQASSSGENSSFGIIIPIKIWFKLPGSSKITSQGIDYLIKQKKTAPQGDEVPGAQSRLVMVLWNCRLRSRKACFCTDESLDLADDDILAKLKLVHFFLVSYLISRVFVKKTSRRTSIGFFDQAITISKLTWILISGTGCFHDHCNVITLLTLLPSSYLSRMNTTHGKGKAEVFPRYPVSPVWGADYGGMGMLTEPHQWHPAICLNFKYPNRHFSPSGPGCLGNTSGAMLALWAGWC